MLRNLRDRGVLGEVAICGGLSLAALSFCAGIVSANSAPADDPFLQWVYAAPMLQTPTDHGTLLTHVPDQPLAEPDVVAPDADTQPDS